MEALLRLGVFLGVLVGMAVWEWRRPRRRFAQARATRWLINLGLSIINTLVVRLSVGAVAVSAAVFAAQHGWGLLPWIGLPTWARSLASLIGLDLAIYLQHVLFHAVPLFWRLHKVHHTDLDLDVTTGVRFHPIEILLSMLYKAALVLLLGAPPGGVIAFEIVLNACSLFTHSNIDIPPAWEQYVRRGLITPDLHRIHHSVVALETDANFGFSVSVWDRLCGTYRDQPRQPHPTMPLGLQEYREPNALRLGQLLLLPFRP